MQKSDETTRPGIIGRAGNLAEGARYKTQNENHALRFVQASSWRT